jgi:hypothetical protein
MILILIFEEKNSNADNISRKLKSDKDLCNNIETSYDSRLNLNENMTKSRRINKLVYIFVALINLARQQMR